MEPEKFDFSINEYLENLNELPEYLVSQKICDDITNNIIHSFYFYKLPTKYLCADVIYVMAKRGIGMLDIVPIRLLTFEICVNLLKISTDAFRYIPNNLEIDVWLEFLKTITEEKRIEMRKNTIKHINYISEVSPRINAEWERIKKLNIVTELS
jgi:hypothetical protein